MEFSRFLGQLESLARFTSDSAKLVTPTLDVSLSLDGCGKIILEGELRSEVGNKLVFRMALDQSYLHDPIKVPRGLLAQYPVQNDDRLLLRSATREAPRPPRIRP